MSYENKKPQELILNDEKTLDDGPVPIKDEGQLPIIEYRDQIMEVLKTAETAIIIGETGSGKTTQIPLFLLDLFKKLKKAGKILVTQPRRVAARSVAKYVAGIFGCKIGKEVGYNVRFEDQTTEGTQLTFMTDGILLRKIQEDPLLSKYSVVMVDEAHERSLNIDFTLGLLKQIQSKRREMGNSLQVIVTSATLEKEKFEKYFNQAPSVEVPGRLHPVDIHYEGITPRNVMDAATEKVKKIVSESDNGDILIFMPGKQEIEDTISKIGELKIPNLEILPLFGDMSPEDQDKIFNKSKKRKVIVATNIAETSITIPGVKYVVDSGLIRQTEYDSNTGIESLLTKYHAKSGVKQRAGRAGRMEAGECYRLYTESDFNNKFKDYQTPEIQRSNLSHVVLTMKKIGIKNVEEFDFIDPPEKKAFESAIKTLKNLGALDESGEITKVGEVMSELPLDPHLGRMVLEANNHGCIREVATIAAFLNGRSVFMRPKDKELEADRTHSQFKDKESDFMSFLNVWNAYALNGFKESWAYNNYLNAKVLAEVDSIRSQLFKVLKHNNIHAVQTYKSDKEAIGKSLTAGLIENLSEHYSRWKYKPVLKDFGELSIFPGSSLKDTTPEWFVCEEVYTNPKGNTFGRTLQVVKPEWIVEVAPQLVNKIKDRSFYEESTDSVVQDMRYYLKSTRTTLINKQETFEGDEAEKIFAEHLSNNSQMLESQEGNKEIIKQLDILSKKSVGQIQSTNLKAEYQKILAGHKIYGVKKLKESLNSNEVDLNLLLENYVDEKLIKQTNENNPDQVNIGGNEYLVKYEYNGYYESDKTNPDKYTARVYFPVDDIFGLKEIPKLPSGRNITFNVISKSGASSQFEGTDLEVLKVQSREYVIRRQWQEWQELSTGGKSKSQRYENYDFSSGLLPGLPETMEFGVDPISKEKLIAYPGFVKDSWYENLNVIYFKSKEEADSNSKQVQDYVNKKLNDKKILEDKEKLLIPVKEKIEEVKNIWREIKHSYSEHGLTYSERDQVDTAIYSAERYVNDNPRQAQEYIDSVTQIIEKAKNYKELKEKSQQLVNEAIDKYYGNLSETDSSLIDFGIDEYGNSERMITLSRLSTNTGKIIAERVYDGNYNESNINMTGRYDRSGNWWQGEPFDSVVFEDLCKILTKEEAIKRLKQKEQTKYEKEERERKESYENDLEYAEQQVESRNWVEGRFRKGINSKNGNEQWEITRGSKGNRLTYIVDNKSIQPKDESYDYFFSIDRTLVDLPGNRVMLVRLQRPYPEDIPKQEVEEVGGEEKVEDMMAKLKALQNKFSKK
jgi:ATP-dependent helicase HrpB